MSNVLMILRTTVIKISLFFILLKKEKGISDFLQHGVAIFCALFYVCDFGLYPRHFVPLLAPNPGDATDHRSESLNVSAVVPMLGLCHLFLISLSAPYMCLKR